MLLPVLDLLAAVEHEGHLFGGDLHEASHVVLAGERDGAVLDTLGNALVGAEDRDADTLQGLLGGRLLFGEPAVDFGILDDGRQRSVASGFTGSRKGAWSQWIPAPIAAPASGPAT